MIGRGSLAAVIGALALAAPAHALLRVDTTVAGVPLKVELSTAVTGSCDSFDPSVCFYPWPNDRFTVPDASTPTGKRLALPLAQMPRNLVGKPIDPTDINRADGFSPGSMIVTKIPGLDNQAAFDATGLVPLTDLDRYADQAQPVVVIDASSGERHPVWAEMDANPAANADRTLIVRPARNFLEGRRYIVALRDLKRADGSPIPAQSAFRAYRDGYGPDPARRTHMESLFGKLAAAGIPRSSLYLAWDFTVASRESLAGRALAIRDDSFKRLGDTNLADLKVDGKAPLFLQNPDLPDDLPDVSLPIDEPDLGLPADAGDVLDLINLEEADGLRNYAPCSAGASPGCEEGESDTIARRVVGQVVVPCYLNLPLCPPGSRFAFAPGSTTPLAIPGNTALANVMCIIPRRAIDGPSGELLRPSLYGHGLLGGASEVGAGNVQRMAQEHGYLFCATDWAGMSTYDLPSIATILLDLSNFPQLADRAQQGFVNFLQVGRAMIHPDGFAKHPAFQRPDGSPIIDTTRLYYDGNSQGGIMGGALAALAVDFDRAVLGVPGMNYSTLLRRSIDFDTYAVFLYASYPNELERPLVLSLMQLLWDRAEANGYAQHMTSDPLPNTPPHEVLLHVAYGDHQVANVTADVEARTIGASIYRPMLYPVRPQYLGENIPGIASFPFGGSASVYWDIGPVRTENGQTRGTGDPPVSNTPPREGRDPHSAPRNSVDGRRQKAAFLRVGGSVIDVCGGLPCRADGWTGP